MLTRLIYFCSRPLQAFTDTPVCPVNRTIRELARRLWRSNTLSAEEAQTISGSANGQAGQKDDSLLVLLIHLFFSPADVTTVLEICDIEHLSGSGAHVQAEISPVVTFVRALVLRSDRPERAHGLVKSVGVMTRWAKCTVLACAYRRTRSSQHPRIGLIRWVVMHCTAPRPWHSLVSLAELRVC